MDKKQHSQQQSSLGGGFLLGLVLGVLITLLFSTKKGRELLKEWTEKGINKLSDLETIIKEQTEQSTKQPDAPENDYIKKDQQQKEQERKLIAQEAEIVEEKPQTVTPPVKKEEPKPAVETPKVVSKPEPEINPAWKPVEPPAHSKTTETKTEKKEQTKKEEVKETKDTKSKKSPIKRFFKRK